MVSGSEKTYTVTIREATEEDLSGILEIVNEQIATSTAIFIDEPLSLENRRVWFREMKKAGIYPVLVAVPNRPLDTQRDSLSSSPAGAAQDERLGDTGATSTILGFAYYTAYQPRFGYRFTVETTVYVHEDARKRGVGSALQKAIMDHARDRGDIHVLVATITANNVASIRFHEKFGYVQRGVLKEIGWKFGRWQDVMYMQLLLPGNGGAC